MLVLHKHQQSLQTLIRLTKGEKRNFKLLMSGIERKHYFQSYRKKQDYKEILWTLVWKQIRLPRLNGQIPRKMQTIETDSRK